MKENMSFVIGTVASTPTRPASGNLLFTVNLDTKYGDHSIDVIVMKDVYERDGYGNDLELGDHIEVSGFLRSSESNPQKLMVYVTSKSTTITTAGKF